MGEHVLGKDEAAGSVPAGGSMRMWRNGNASPCRGEDPGPIPGIRSRGALDQLAGVTALRPQDVRGSNPAGATHGLMTEGLGTGLQSRLCGFESRSGLD